MNFKLYHTYESPNFNLSEKAFFIVIPIFLLGAYMVIKEGHVEKIGIVLILFSVVFVTFFKIRSAFSKYESTKELLGTLNINKEQIVWDKTVIQWKDILKFDMQKFEIDGDYKPRINDKNNISDGINPISITTRRNEKYDGYYHLESELMQTELTQILASAVYFNQLEYPIAKQLIQLKNYQEHQDLKKKLSSLRSNKP